MKHLREQTPPIRVSTGWGFANDFQPLQHQELANITDGLELSLTQTQRFYFYLDNVIDSLTTSVHLSSPIPEEHREPLQDIRQIYDIEGFVMHPQKNVTAMHDCLKDLQLEDVVMMENLDSKFETDVSETMLASNLGFLATSRMTIDIQHLSEHYTLSQAFEFIETKKNIIQQFHVSGRTGNNRHELVSQDPRNRSEIDSIVEHISEDEILSEAPLVIEGKYQSLEEVEKEYNYLRRFYG